MDKEDRVFADFAYQTRDLLMTRQRIITRVDQNKDLLDKVPVERGPNIDRAYLTISSLRQKTHRRILTGRLVF